MKKLPLQLVLIQTTFQLMVNIWPPIADNGLFKQSDKLLHINLVWIQTLKQNES